MRMEMYSSSSRLKWEQVELQTYWCPVLHHVDHRNEVCQCAKTEEVDLKQRISEEGEGKSLHRHFIALFQMLCRAVRSLPGFLQDILVAFNKYSLSLD